MQTLSDVLDMPIHISGSKQACALGSAMFAATVAGIYPNVEAAQTVIIKYQCCSYTPNKEKHEIYAKRYEYYKKLGAFSER